MSSAQIAVATSAFLLTIVCPGSAASTSPGKNAVFASDSGGSLMPNGCLNTLLTASLAKGKRNRVVAVEATIHSNGSGNADLPCLHPTVNGIAMEPFPAAGYFFGVASSCAAAAECNVSGTFWLDLDAAEAAHPGVFIGQPLTIVLSGGDALEDGGGNYAVSMTVRMEKR